MINYLKSELYRLLHKKSLHLTSIICFLLILAAGLVLSYLPKVDPSFPYATSPFFYSNVISSGVLILIVGLLFNIALTGKDITVIKQSVAFGISRKVIFWSKLILTLGYFIIVCLIGIGLMVVLGENLFTSDTQVVISFLLACLNMIPIILSGFLIIHTLKMIKVGEAYIVITLFFIYTFSGDILRPLFRSVSGLNNLYQYAPSTLLTENLLNFMNESVKFEFSYWLIGVVISLITLLIGSQKFAKISID